MTGDGKKPAERTREKILEAAMAEFGAKGYSGARTAAIAERAGVNAQLISYYFGGKQGLLDALRRLWAGTEAEIAVDGATFVEAVSAYLDATLDRPDWARLVIWRALGDHPGAGAPGDDTGDDGDAVGGELRGKLRAAVERTRRRQRDGELTDRVEPEFIQLLAHVLAFAPIALPHIVGAIFDLDPLSPQYRQRSVAQLEELLRPESRGES